MLGAGSVTACSLRDVGHERLPVPPRGERAAREGRKDKGGRSSGPETDGGRPAAPTRGLGGGRYWVTG